MASLLLVVALLVIGVVLLYKHRNQYWKSRGIPGPEPSLFVGNIFDLINPNFPGVLKLREWSKKYGKYYGIYEGWRRVLVLSDVDMLQELFVKKFEYFHGRKLFALAANPDKEPNVHVFDARGARWKRLRNLSNTSFTVSNLKKVLPTVQHSVDVMVEFMAQKADTGESFNIHSYYQELTLDVIARIAMGQRGSRQFENEYLEDVVGVFSRHQPKFLIVTPLVFPFLQKFFRRLLVTLSALKLRKVSFRDLLNKVSQAVQERKEARARGEREEMDEFGNARVDFIDLFLDAECDEVKEKSEFDRSGRKSRRS
ncbi:hypothetical protein L596_019043 [Steinernema carpocapsae]|uniref:Cytochrome P450 n=1 Tax=Steinernema carpocapsae TaxID=34508 RepID=A0A4U5N7H9_STECR|nr:hypothetical protein L596_019043 [Steinernema carpocapsae]